MTNDGIILLSGGLDSAASLALMKGDIKLALFFDYHQKSLEYEKIAATKLCAHYGIDLKIIKLDWLAEITHTSLVDKNMSIPLVKDDDFYTTKIAEHSKNVWVPNRNALFINIAGSFADSYGYSRIIIGANNEEAQTFSDNSKSFISAATSLLQISTNVKPIVFAPLIDYNKPDIIKLANKLKLPFNLIRSCYSDLPYHCGKCESCQRLKKGLETEGLFDIVDLIFNIKEA